ncbi:MAG TPA: hypothetical protein VNV35_09265 [Puia sp.]|jgi:hypothetical protein|nr:hypothetical protein [Puia sp.]
MKKLYSVLVLLCWLTLPARSQSPQAPPAGGGWAGQLEALKTTFITTRLQLTPLQAEKFWPIYNMYDSEVHQANFIFRHSQNPNVLEHQKILLAIREKYAVEFLKAIPPPKINAFWAAEQDFNRLVQQEINHRRRGMPVGPPPGP